MDAQEASNRAEAGAFQIELEGPFAQRQIVAFRFGVRGEIAAAGLAAVALRASPIETALDDGLVLVARGARWLFHTLMVSVLCTFRHCRHESLF